MFLNVMLVCMLGQPWSCSGCSRSDGLGRAALSPRGRHFCRRIALPNESFLVRIRCAESVVRVNSDSSCKAVLRIPVKTWRAPRVLDCWTRGHAGPAGGAASRRHSPQASLVGGREGRPRGRPDVQACAARGCSPVVSCGVPVLVPAVPGGRLQAYCGGLLWRLIAEGGCRATLTTPA